MLFLLFLHTRRILSDRLQNTRVKLPTDDVPDVLADSAWQQRIK